MPQQMNAETPSFQPAIAAVQGYANDRARALSPEAQETLREVIRRLERLSVQVEELIGINNSLLATSFMTSEFDPSSDTIIVRAGGAEIKVQLRRADQNVPITQKTLSVGEAYQAGLSRDVSPERAKLRLEMESKLEAFYYSAHRVLKLLAKIPGLPAIKCMAVTQVRNNLIEHPEKGKGKIYSFGFGSTGPRIKPMHKGDQVWNDEGLVPNAKAFLDAIVAGFSAGPRQQAHAGISFSFKPERA